MDLRLSASELAFRTRLRAWLGETLPGLPAKPVRDADHYVVNGRKLWT